MLKKVYNIIIADIINNIELRIVYEEYNINNNNNRNNIV